MEKIPLKEGQLKFVKKVEDTEGLYRQEGYHRKELYRQALEKIKTIQIEQIDMESFHGFLSEDKMSTEKRKKYGRKK